MVVRMENYRVLEKLMLAVKPNTVINQLLDHLGDRRAATRYRRRTVPRDLRSSTSYYRPSGGRGAATRYRRRTMPRDLRLSTSCWTIWGTGGQLL